MSRMPGDSLKAIITAAGEAIRELSLGAPQYVNPEMFADPEVFQDTGAMIYADQH